MAYQCKDTEAKPRSDRKQKLCPHARENAAGTSKGTKCNSKLLPNVRKRQGGCDERASLFTCARLQRIIPNG
jgi:hypothetical protein